jgi:hypothetical protein
MSNELKQRAREVCEALAALDGGKKPGTGVHGQAIGCEPWVIRTNGYGLQCLHDAQELLHELLDPFDQRAPVVSDQVVEEPKGDTGNAEADRLINRLMSSDPDFDDCAAAATFIRRIVSVPAAGDDFPLPAHQYCLNSAVPMAGYTEQQLLQHRRDYHAHMLRKMGSDAEDIDTLEFQELLANYADARTKNMYSASFDRVRAAFIAHINAKLAQARAAGSEDASLRTDEATRLRRVVNLLDLQGQLPGADDRLRDCLFSVLGLMARKIEEGRAADAEQDGQVEQVVPAGWLFYTSDFSTVASGRAEKGSVTLMRDAAGRAEFHALATEGEKDAFQLYVNGTGSSLREAIANAVANIAAAPSADDPAKDQKGGA